jgi:hypothetical protein
VLFCLFPGLYLQNIISLQTSGASSKYIHMCQKIVNSSYFGS